MHEGYQIIRDAAPGPLLAALRDCFAEPGPLRRGGLRNALEVHQVREAVEVLRPLAMQLAGEMTFMSCVRGIVFDKSPSANWKVARHQDRSIAVAERHDIGAFGPWSIKDGIVHVQPPMALLERMITLRLHLDECTESAGPLRVMPRTHCLGILSDAQINQLRRESSASELQLTCSAGDVIAMRPLLLHASSAAIAPSRRRVVHLEFAAGPLPNPLAWRWSV